MSTPHNRAEKGEISKTVLMPGDPLRAKFIAENFLTDAVIFNDVRNMFGFTGKYKGKAVSVMGSGMGMPSIGIYSYELYNFYDVENIIRVGTAGGIGKNVALRDVVIGQGACTNSNYAKQFNLNGSYSPIASFSLLEKAVLSAREKNVSFHVGNLYSSDTFYDADSDVLRKWAEMNVLAVEMEAAALYINAAKAGKNALCIATISDLPLKGESTTADERQTTFTAMMEIALETAFKL